MRRIAGGVGGVVLATLLIGGVAVGVGAAQSTGLETNASVGADVSSFMQASGAEAEGELDDGMFDAALNRTTDSEERRALIEERKERLEERHQALRTQRDAIDGESNVRKHALATRVSVGAAGLERSVNTTESAATKSDVETDRLGAIRSNASELRSPDVAALARGLVGPPEPPAAGRSDDGASEIRTEVNRSVDNDTSSPESAAARSSEYEARESRRTGPPNGDDFETRPGGDSSAIAQSSSTNGTNGDRGVSYVQRR